MTNTPGDDLPTPVPFGAAPSSPPPSDSAVPPEAPSREVSPGGPPSGGVIHLDAAGAARSSQATLDAQAMFLRAETVLGAYAAEQQAAGILRTARGILADLLGPGLRTEDVVFHHSASGAFATLLAAWPLRPGARIGVVRSEYGANRLVLESSAARMGCVLLDLPVDEYGLVDLDGLDRAGLVDHGPHRSDPGAGGGLESLDLLVFPHVPSQRGVVQPAAELGRRCADAGVGLIVDVAQSAGQVDTAGIGADAYVGTSRKWLRGPRGAAFLALREGVAQRLGVGVPSLYSAARADDDPPPAALRTQPSAQAQPSPQAQFPRLPRPLPGAARVSVGEASVVARIGLAQALGELVEAGSPRVFARIAALGAHGRRVLDGAGGFRVREPVDTPSGIITLQPPPGVDPFAVRDHLYREHRILTSAIPAARARDLFGPLLRASAHVYNDPADLDRLADALARLPR
ncbi:hercynylcysteine S-oxide lyase [Frankia sp. AiPs1]|uniref:aminotransferase class V-fold PLP-dependent enzyme n=1 Tax=Frankia sp. AiPa1 TaxID=573492 RepID=UPI00202B336C|nr:aminotransferase class V-fold PLP-dependent enzyme [Frankia sp. AiPa1]MCL9760804.1 aminotransferase class V-fold PLP-dependent enzyme [Frankia sp. AiPa1]